MKILKVRHVEELAHKMAQLQMEWDEPIPDFGTRYPGKLESCLVQSFQTYAKRDLYPGLIAKTAILFYLMIKNHPFMNGNKRIAVTTVLTFLLLNKKWLRMESELLYELAVWIAKSDPKLKEEVVNYIEGILKRNLVDLK
jgi:death on curing protein